MIVILRFIGLVNAAVWFGSALFFTFAVGPAFFSDAMLGIFGGAQSPYSKAWAGLSAMVVIKRFFIWHHVCGAIAIVHGVAEAAYQGLPFKQLRNLLAIVIFSLGLAGGLWLQPAMATWQTAKYNQSLTPELREQASRKFAAWHGVSQIANLLMTAGLLVFFWKTAVPAQREAGANPFQFKS